MYYERATENCLQNFQWTESFLHYPRGAKPQSLRVSFSLQRREKKTHVETICFCKRTQSPPLKLNWNERNFFPLFSHSERVKLAETRVSFTEAKLNSIRQFWDVFTSWMCSCIFFGSVITDLCVSSSLRCRCRRCSQHTINTSFVKCISRLTKRYNANTA